MADSGWSWVVSGAACFNSLVLAGIFRTSGVLFVALIAQYGVTREEASWPMVLCIAVLNLTGPFSGLLAQRFGVRPVVIAGAVVGAVGMSACFFTTSLGLVTFFFGGIFGVGYGLVSTLMPVIVNVHFLNLRTTANGIANSGSCIGSVLLPILFEYLIDHFGLPGCFLLTGGIVLNVAIAGALMRPPETTTTYYMKTNVPTDYIPCQNELTSSINEEKKYPVYKEPDAHNNLRAELVSMLNRRNVLQKQHPSAKNEYPYDSLDTSMCSFYVQKTNGQIKVDYDIDQAQNDLEEYPNDFQNAVLEIIDTSQSAEGLHRFDPDEMKTSKLTDNCPARHSFSALSRERTANSFKSPIPSFGPLKRYNLKHAHTSAINSPDLPTVKENGDKGLYEIHQSQKVNAPSVDKQNQTGIVYNKKGIKRTPGTLESFAMVASSPMFYITSITSISFYFLFHMFVNIIIDYSLDCGVADEDTKYVLFSFALCDLIGRLGLGWITDRKFLSRQKFVMMGMASIGLVFFLFPITTSLWSLVVASGCYGLLLGCTMIVFPILILEYLGSEIHAVACGCLCFMNGFAPFARPFLIGYFRDNLGSYENMFYVLGLISVLTSVCWLFERYLVQNRHVPLDDEEQRMQY